MIRNGLRIIAEDVKSIGATFRISNEMFGIINPASLTNSLIIRKVAPIDFTSFANNPQPILYHQPIFFSSCVCQFLQSCGCLSVYDL